MDSLQTTLLQPAKKAGRKYLNPVPTQVGGLKLMFKILPLYFANREDREPQQPLGPFRTDPSIYSAQPKSGLRITWFGHSSSLVELDGVRILIDPVWDTRASPTPWFGPKRFFAPTLALEDLPPLDAILISHDHYDHLGEQTIRRLATSPNAAAARWVTSLGVGAILQRFGVPAPRIAELDWTQSTTVSAPTGDPCEIVALPARHFSGRSLSNRFETLWSSFVLRGQTSNGLSHTVYYGADSGQWDGFSEIARAYGPFDLTMLEIGAWNNLWSNIHLGPDGAAHTFQQMGAHGLLMPIHWGLFDLALHAWRQPIERMTQIASESKLKLFSPAPGEPSEVVRNAELRSTWWHRSITDNKKGATLGGWRP
jgi:L-ascorbate metabolism protein UlaG (beta-lactamase superfamily)